MAVHQGRLGEFETGILSDRQKNWLSGKSNEHSVENPVVYKHAKDKQKKERSAKNKLKEKEEVRGLLDNFPSQNVSSGNVIERTQQARKERHDAALDDMLQELAAIALALEPQIEHTCQTYKGMLMEQRDSLEEQMQVLKEDSDLERFTHEALIQISVSVCDCRLECETIISRLNEDLHVFEEERSQMIASLFYSFTKKLEKIAHLMPADVHRLMEDYIVDTNSSILANHVAYADLIKKLSTTIADDTKKSYVYWEGRLKEWKELKVAAAVGNFKSLMASEEVVNNPFVNDYLTEMMKKQNELNKERLKLLQQLQEMKPPCSKTSVHQWNNAVSLVTSNIDEVHSKYIKLIGKAHLEVDTKCKKFMEQTLAGLRADHILPDEPLEAQLDEEFQTFIGEQQSTTSNQLAAMQSNLEEMSAEQKEELKRLFLFAQAAAHEWDCHELGLAKAETALQDLLDKSRREHDYQNQIKEAKLDIAMDRMRQESSEDALTASLKQVVAMLEEIKAGYTAFNAHQITLCDEYPRLVMEEMKRYKEDVKRMFSEKPISDHPNLKTRLSAIGAKQKSGSGEIHAYLNNFALTDELFEELKVSIRDSFLSNLSSRSEELKLTSDRVKLMKVEEINNELDLRLHLHEPRVVRATQDVHNVRAAELLQHKDRVNQHCDGVQNALQSLRDEFQTMIDEQGKETENFKRSVDELESSFGDATKPHQLKAIQGQVNGKLDEHMEIIRASVRHFRFSLDDILNKLRTSNANFRKNLKIFSEGGNFSPDEVEEFRKKLEKCAGKIDTVEGSLMSELEGLETKRMASAKDFAGKLEDRFKHHLVDLTFIDKISRWLSNIQVKIKTEVADSNSQCQHISKLLSTFHRRLQQLQQNDPDEEVISAEEVHDTVLPICEALQKRIFYLQCAANEKVYRFLEEYHKIIQGVPEEVKIEPVEPILKPSPEKTPKRRHEKRKGRSIEAVLDGSKSKEGRSTPLKDQHEHLISKESSSSPLDAMGSALAQFESGKGSPHSMYNGKGSPHSMYNGHRRGSGKLTHFGGKYDKKYLVFGEYYIATEKSVHFSESQLQVLQLGLDGLLCTAEIYYKQKGMRATTRPDLINDSFDSCAENLISRLRKYHTQTKEYCNSCIQEFRTQIKLFISCMERLPALLMNHLCKRHLVQSKARVDEFKRAFNTSNERLELKKREHQTLLRPTLGHPNSRRELHTLKNSEDCRKTQSEELVVKYEEEINNSMKMDAARFIEELQTLVDILLLQSDHVITLKDISAEVKVVKPMTEMELLQRRVRKVTISDEDTAQVEDVPTTWPAIDLTRLGDVQIDCQIRQAASRKTFQCHQAAIMARNTCYEEFASWFTNEAGKLRQKCDKHKQDEERWETHWNDSLKKIVGFYSL